MRYIMILALVAIVTPIESHVKKRHRAFRIQQVVPVPNDPGHVMIGDFAASTNCSRPCVTRGAPETCYYNWTLIENEVMGPACKKCGEGVLADCSIPGCVPADGVQQKYLSISKMLPGPSIDVCQYDRVVVDVHNLAGLEAAIHWAGVRQRNTCFMDGSPMVTQCPITDGDSFRYDFVAEYPGTKLYVGHSARAKMNAYSGAFVVRQYKNSDDLSSSYTYDLPEHEILLSDWSHENAQLNSNNILVNGKGKYTDPKTREKTKVPYQAFYVKSNEKYLFRIINNAYFKCAIQFQIEEHQFTLFASGGGPLQPIVIDTLVTYPGERFDIIIDTHNKPGAYWMRMTGIGICEVDEVEQFAVLVYDEPETLGIQPTEPEPLFSAPYPDGVIVNYPNTECGKDTARKCITDLKSMYAEAKLLGNYLRHRKIYLSLGRSEERAYFNNITYDRTPSPLLTQHKNAVDKGHICKESDTCSRDNICACTQIIKLKKDEIIELILTNENANIVGNPIHFHGYFVYVTGMGPLKDAKDNSGLTKSIDSSHPLDRVTSYAPLVDTVVVPSGGYVILRFVADNPGFWTFLSYFKNDFFDGMALLFQVGDVKTMAQPPPGFPTCGK